MSTVPATCRIYTPPVIADAMVKALGDSPNSMWLEPCFGRGAFIHALYANGVPSSRIKGIDLDRRRAKSDDFGHCVRGAEFFGWATEAAQRSETFDRIIGNPPFASFGRFSSDIQTAAREFVADQNLSRGTNIWVFFLLASLKLLRAGGHLGFILPASWEYADYAHTTRQLIRSSFSDVRVHRSSQPLFSNAEDGSIVLLCYRHKANPSTYQIVRHPDGPELTQALAEHRRWQPALSPNSSIRGRFRRLGDVMKLSIGAVCGQADYFLLTEEQRQQFSLPGRSLTPALTRTRHLKGAFHRWNDWKNLRAEGERIWLFSPSGVILSHPAVRSYLRRTMKKGGCDRKRTKIRDRKPWFNIPLPKSIDGVLSGNAASGPWVCLLETRRVTVTNTLYTVRFIDESLSKDEKAAWSLGLLTSLFRLSLESVARHYPAGLTKYEPGDLENLTIPQPSRFKGAARLYKRAVASLISGAHQEAFVLADSWFNNSKA